MRSTAEVEIEPKPSPLGNLLAQAAKKADAGVRLKSTAPLPEKPRLTRIELPATSLHKPQAHPAEPEIEDAESWSTRLLPARLKALTQKRPARQLQSKPPRPGFAEQLKMAVAPRKSAAKRVFALDVGTSSIKLVEIEIGASHPKLLNAEIRPIPPAMRKNKDSLNILLTKEIRDLLPPGRLKGAELHVVLPNKNMFIRRMDMAQVAEKERLNAIKFQLRKDLPKPVRDRLPTCSW